MAIKVTVGEQKTQNEKPFPKLMVHEDGTITRFKTPGVGAHIYDPNKKLYSEKSLFVEYTRILMNKYSDFEGSITLQNES